MEILKTLRDLEKIFENFEFSENFELLIYIPSLTVSNAVNKLWRELITV